jgi:hypothetical protein
MGGTFYAATPRPLRSALVVVALLCAGILISPVPAVAQTAKDLAGAWAWVSVETTRADGAAFRSESERPCGFDGNGGFAYLLSRPDRAKFGGNSREDGTPEENKATVQGTLVRRAPTPFSGNVLTFKVEASTYPTPKAPSRSERSRILERVSKVLES